MPFPKGISLKVNVIAWLEFELTSRLQSSILAIILLYNHNTHLIRNIIKHNIRTSMNERIHFFIKIYLSHFILGDVYCVWEMSWKQGQTAILTQVLLTIAALLSHLGLGLLNCGSLRATKSSVCKSVLTPASCLQLTQTIWALGYIIV